MLHLRYHLASAGSNQSLSHAKGLAHHLSACSGCSGQTGCMVAHGEAYIGDYTYRMYFNAKGRDCGFFV